MIYYQRKGSIMIKPVTMYSVVCDRCGKTFIDEFNGIVAWLDEGTAKEQAMESEWVEIGDNHYCPDCYEFNDVLNVYVPKKKGWICYRSEGGSLGHIWYKHQEYPFILKYNNFLGICDVSFNEGKNYAVMIKCVDELQHLLFGLGLDSSMIV